MVGTDVPGERLDGIAQLLAEVRGAKDRTQLKGAMLSLAHAVSGVRDEHADAAVANARAHGCAAVLAAQLKASQGTEVDHFLHALALSILANLAYLGLEEDLRRAGCVPHVLAALQPLGRADGASSGDRARGARAALKTLHYAVAAVQNVRGARTRRPRATVVRALATCVRALSLIHI